MPLVNTDLMAHFNAPSRGIVIFNNHKALVWQSDEGLDVIAWAQSFDSPKNEAARENGGVFHAVVYTIRAGFNTYETDH